jgi:hypothetical protein
MARYARSELIRSNSGLAAASRPCGRELRSIAGIRCVHAVAAGIQARRGLMCGAW